MKTMRATHRAPRAARSSIETLLERIGVDPVLAESVVGDLAEEYAERAARDGAGAARWWYVREALRSAPHLAWSALRRLDHRGRMRLAAGIAGAGVATCVALLWWSAGAGPPVRLVTGVRDTVVVNHVKAVSLATRVLDADGRVLPDTGVRYARIAGAPVELSARGVVTCPRRGDAIVRASLGALATDVVLLCRPVRDARAAVWNDFLVGDPARELPTEFTGVDGEPVTLLSARLSVDDSTVATLDGLHIRPLRAGRTHLGLSVGNRWAGGEIRVFAPVAGFEGLRPDLRPDERLVAASVRLAPGDSVRLRLPMGLLNLVFLARATAAGGGPAPLLRVDGPVMCLPVPGPRVYNSRCLVRAAGATVTLAHPGAKAPAVVGALALEWERER
ncbi:hypothetical protein [Roseisolibacter agri]|uniref:Uncharacterized protein n=1 Tax=Roseisolibacter agri TaxID=2014610 RepID=A0AA37Q148_9BACT|nr:hypothetical protein [Roseisolibacter agri]GLC24459.1 hypothetical protein rosag_09720 [Roseisolibacter agri]